VAFGQGNCNGFSRSDRLPLGLVLALPALGIGIWLAALEWQTPSGPPKAYASHADEGLMAWKPEKTDAAIETLLAEQRFADIDAPSGFPFKMRITSNSAEFESPSRISSRQTRTPAGLLLGRRTRRALWIGQIP
jgi:hypothetical protein